MVAKVAATLRDASRIAGPLGIEPASDAAQKACAHLLATPDSCTVPADDGCAPSLVGLFSALRDARARLPERRAVAADVIAADAFDAASRLALAHDALARGACQEIAAAGSHPTQMLLGPDGRSLLVRPLSALRAGRRYAVVARGSGAADVARLRESLVPKPGADALVIPQGAFATAVEQTLAGDGGGISSERTASLVRRLEQDAAAMPGLAAFSGVRVTLPQPVRAEQIGTLQLAFVPAAHARPEETLAVFSVLDARTQLLADRARLATLACDDSVAETREVKPTLGARLPHVARLLHGRYRSLDVVGDGGAAQPFGVPAATAAPLDLPFLLALPADVKPDTPLVLTIDGHAGSAVRMLGKHADGLAERGMAVLAVELPLHGERAVAGRDILDALDPAGFGRNMRQATIDALAAVQAATRCGLRLPGGERLRVAEVRYLGYSLGAMVGAIARSVEPALGTTVLVAPGGDILGWLALRVSPSLGATYVTCLGGAQEGGSCIPNGECVAPGTCITDPYLDRMGWLMTLPYELAAAVGDPLSYVTHRTGVASKGRLLMITGGEDAALFPALATRLADAYGMQPVAAHRRRGPRSRLVQWPQLGHELIDHGGVRAQIVEFLASNGRRLLLPQAAAGPQVPGWYRVYGASRK